MDKLIDLIANYEFVILRPFNIRINDQYLRQHILCFSIGYLLYRFN